MFRCIILVMLCLLILVACKNNVCDSQTWTDEATSVTESDFTEYELTKLDLDIPFNPNNITSHDSGFVLENGSVVVQKFGSMRKGNTYYYHYIYDADGKRIHPGKDKEKYYQNYYRVVLETDQGNIIITDNSGKTRLFDSTWNEIDTPNELTFYHGYHLDNGKYFAINDEYELNYEYAPGVDSGGETEVRYALYKYTEKITDTIFSKIIPCDDGFECIYADSIMPIESITIKADDMVQDEIKSFSISFDSTTGKYYCINDAGEKIFEESFDYISKPNNNSSIAFIDNCIYLIQPSTKTNLQE